VAGTRYGIRASRILRLARTSRWATVDSGTRNARAMAAVSRPPIVRSVSATWASRLSAGWQHANSSGRRSSAAIAPPVGGGRSISVASAVSCAMRSR
jgi:hypothetical protein